MTNGSVTIRNGYDSKYDKYILEMKREDDDTWITSYFSKDQYKDFANMMLRLIERNDLDENEFTCYLCKTVIWHNPAFPITQYEKDHHICYSCDEKINKNRLEEDKRMRKGEKLYKFLETKIDEYVSSPMLSPSSNTAEELFSALYYLKNMTDEEFDQIIK